MRKWINIFAIICIVAITLTGCVQMSTETYEVAVTTEDLLKTAPLVFLGRVKAEGKGWYRNAEEVHYYDDGHAMFNYWITPYMVEVLEVYKGDISEDITELTLGTYNRHSPADNKQNDGEEKFYLEKGDTAVFCVQYLEVDGCYKPLYGRKGVFFATEAKNEYVAENNVIDISKIEETLAKATINGNDMAAASGNTVDIKPEDKKQEQK